jgi:hypothetical protein
MRDTFDQIRDQIHEIRNLVGPVNLKLANMEHQIVTSRAFLEERAMTLESKLLGALFRMDKQDLKIADLMASQEKLLERMNRFERQSPG